MLADDVFGRPYSKAEHRRTLLSLLNGRSEGSIEFKHQNISAVLKGLGEDWIPGYKPAFNFQMSLVDAVVRWLAINPAWLGRLPDSRPATGLEESARSGSAHPRRCRTSRHRRSWSRCCTSLGSSMWQAGTSATAPSAAPARSAFWRMSGHRYGRRGVMTWRGRCVGFPRRTGMAQATISRVSRQMVRRA